MAIGRSDSSTRSARRSRTAGSSSSSPSSSTCTAGRAPSSSRPPSSTASSRTARASPASRPARSASVPSDPDIAAIPDLDSFTPVPWQPNLARFACDVTVEGEAWPYCPRTILRNVIAKAAEQGYTFKIGRRARVLPRAPGRRRLDRDRRQVRHAREALLRHRRPHAAVRLPDAGLEVLQRARLGQLRERPRGRERPVRAELPLRRGARDAATARSSSATWCTRSRSSTASIATFMPKPFTHLTGNGCHFHMSLWKGDDERLPRRGRPARARPLGRRLPLRRRPQGARPRVQRPHRAHGQLVQAAQGRARPRAGRRGRPSGSRTATTTAPRCSASPGRAASRTARSTARATRIWLRRRSSPPVSTGWRKGLDAGEPNSENLYDYSYEELTARGLRALPANLLDAVGELERGRRAARGARPRRARTRTTSTTTSASSATSGSASTSR